MTHSSSAHSSSAHSVYALAIHTASPELGLAISDFSGDSRCQVWDLGRSLSTRLHIQLADFIKPQTWQDLAFIAVAKGPGGFTGTRIGVVTARTLAQQLDIPLFAFSTLEVAAWHQIRSAPQSDLSDVAIAMRAQRGEVFAAIYSAAVNRLTPTPTGLTIQQPETVMHADQWQHILESWHRSYQRVDLEGGLGAFASSLLELARLRWQQGDRPHWSTVLPYYGQSPV
ncbi:MAG: tRNA (adenosine(37)-N6)-threonylcarbamoyltransferase complex dimerization subunit type 1 TsaB [Elainellaceae cyanobacterium]